MKNLKKVLALVVVFTMMLSTVAFAAYPDVAEDAEYAAAVEVLSALGILKGDDQGNFNPDADITRAEFAAVVCRAIGMENDANAAKGATAFTDVAADHWATGYINVANQMGIINGMGDGTFAPEANVTFEQAVKMLACSLGYEYIAQSNGGYPTGYLVAANRHGVTKGVKATSNEPAARSVVAELVYNALEAPLMEQGVWGTEEEWYVYDGFGVEGSATEEKKELLANRLEVLRLTGQVVANEKAALSGSPAEKGEIRFDINARANGGYEPTDLFSDSGFGANLNDRRFVVGDSNADVFFANQVDIYVTETSRNVWEIVCIVEEAGKNTVTTIASTDVHGGADTYATRIAYWKTADAKITTKLDIATTARIVANNGSSNAIYASVPTYITALEGGRAAVPAVYRYFDAAGNEVPAGDPSIDPTRTELVSPASPAIAAAPAAQIELIDWDNDYKYDVLLVSEYIHALVDSVNVTAGMIKTEMAPRNVNLRLNDEDVIVTIKDTEGNKLALEDIQEGDVIAMLCDGDGNPAGSNWENLDIIVIPSEKATVTGTVTETAINNATQGNIVATDVIYVDGEPYGLNVENGGNRIYNFEKLVGLNSVGTFYLDINGRIIGFEGDKAVDGDYAFILQTGLSNDPVSRNKILMKVLTKDGEIVTYTVGDTVSIPGVNAATASYDTTTATATFPAAGFTGAAQWSAYNGASVRDTLLSFGALDASLGETTFDADYSGSIEATYTGFSNALLSDRFVKLGVNSSGKVTKIVVPGVETKFTGSTLVNEEYKADDTRFAGRIFTDGAVVFVLDAKDAYEASTVKGVDSFVNEGQYTLSMYKDGSTTYDVAVVISGTSKLASKDGIAIVKNVSETKTANNDDALIIRFIQNGDSAEKTITLVQSEATDLTNGTAAAVNIDLYKKNGANALRTGDVFTYTTKGEDIVDTFAVIAQLDNTNPADVNKFAVNAYSGEERTYYAANAWDATQTAIYTKDVDYAIGYIDDIEGNVVTLDNGAAYSIAGANEYYYRRYDTTRYDLTPGAYQLGYVDEDITVGATTYRTYVLIKTVDDVVTDIYAIDDDPRAIN